MVILLIIAVVFNAVMGGVNASSGSYGMAAFSFSIAAICLVTLVKAINQ